MKKILITLIYICLCGCVGHSPKTNFYVMNSQNLETLSNKNMNIVVNEVEVPELLDRSQIVVYETDLQQIDVMEFNRWGEPLPDILQSTISGDLSAYFPKSFVLNKDASGQQNVYFVNVHINKIEAIMANKVKLSVFWNIKNSNDAVLTKQQKKYEVVVNGSDVLSLVNAQNKVLHLLSKDIAQSLLKL